jgi:TRAP-type C4-dicarboxylate transport system permease large subunit
VPPFVVAMPAIVLLVAFFPELALRLPRTAGFIRP